MSNCKNAQAVAKLLTEDKIENFIEKLDELWETWIISEITDTADASVRADMLYKYKCLRKMLESFCESSC